MSILTKIARRGPATFQLIDGRQFVGRIASLPDSVPENVAPSRGLIRIPAPCLVVNGDIMVAPDNSRFILTEGPTLYVDGTVAVHSFRMLPVNRQLTWGRPTTQTDPVSGVETDSVIVAMPQVQGYLQVVEAQIDRSSKTITNFPKWKFYTNAALQENDTLNVAMTVVRVEIMGGVTVADVR